MWWDPDDDGPLPSSILVGGTFDWIGGKQLHGIGWWDGTDWHPVGSGLSALVYAMTSFDFDGPGPNPARLVAAGGFTVVNGVALNGIAWWNGSAWQPLGTGMNGEVDTLAEWNGELYAGGTFTTAGGVAAAGVARWTGSAWAPLGTGVTNGTPSLPTGVRSLQVWDPDGNGPQPSVLVAGGHFYGAGGVSVRNVAKWDGSTWQAIGSNLYNTDWSNDVVDAIGVWDPDADGPQPPILVAGGGFRSPYCVAQWNGTTWTAMGPGLYNPATFNTTVYSFLTWDPDGPGPMASRLVALGSFTQVVNGISTIGAATWNGSSWSSIGTGAGIAVRAGMTMPGAGVGGSTALLAVGSFATSDNYTYRTNGIALWDSVLWRPLGNGLDDRVQSMTVWDPDGPGPQSEQVFVGGSFKTVGGTVLNGIGRWDGAAWHPLGSGLGGTAAGVPPYAWTMTPWDPDGDGPLPPVLVVAGYFTTAGGVAANNLATWNGSQWSALGPGTPGSIYTLTTWDPDGDGPLPPRLCVGGSFSTIGGVAANNIALWDGTSWSALGTGVGDGSAIVRTLCTWDPDGPGPQPPLLVAGGTFSTAGGASAAGVAVWNGTSWSAMGGGLTGGSTYTLATVDPDGTGPATPQLFAGGDFMYTTTANLWHVARWDGAAWQPMYYGLDSTVYALTAWDPDGPGPGGQQLIAAGSFASNQQGTTLSRAARWTGTAWAPLGTGIQQGYASAVATWSPPGRPRQSPVVGGLFDAAGGMLPPPTLPLGARRELRLWRRLLPRCRCTKNRTRSFL